VGLFVFALLFAVKARNFTESAVPQLVTFVTGVLGLACLAVFLFLIDYAARLLRPVSLVRIVGQDGLAVVGSVYPGKFVGGGEEAGRCRPGAAARTVIHEGSSAIVLAVDVQRLVAEAEKANGVIEFAPQVGDFVGQGEPLFLLYGSAAGVDDQMLNSCVIFGSERTLEQDPLFAFRILVDIAIKALSAAINDPTTAVLAIDQLQRLLRSVGRRNLHADHILNRAGALRVILRVPDWSDFVKLAFTEIRFCGASNVQIARRLRGMIVNLANTLPVERHAALRQEHDLLDAMLEKLYALPEDLALARIADSQGFGGSSETTAARWAT
jgi:uncharacterized membrane protein